jgi:hypothetical protein
VPGLHFNGNRLVRRLHAQPDANWHSKRNGDGNADCEFDGEAIAYATGTADAEAAPHSAAPSLIAEGC